MERYHYPLKRLGIIGGGQLGRMMIDEAHKLGISVAVLDPDSACPCAAVADRFFCGSLYDSGALAALVAECDVTTYEIEHISADALAELAASGHVLRPQPAVLGLIQDKLRQKQAFADAGISVPRFVGAEVPTDPAVARLGFPCVQKLRHGGYDGRGVRVLRSPEDGPLSGPSIFEEFIRFDKELAVVCARFTDGTTASYPVSEMIFDPDANICTHVISPARVDGSVATEAERIATEAVMLLGGEGVFAVEFLYSEQRGLFLNEVAPRPHNSGHLTIEACDTGQFEQHIRAVTGWSSGSTREHTPAVMVNLLGAGGEKGPAEIHGIDWLFSVAGAHVHLYGKTECRPGRKMGHVTVLRPTVTEALEIANQVLSHVQIYGRKSNATG